MKEDWCLSMDVGFMIKRCMRTDKGCVCLFVMLG